MRNWERSHSYVRDGFDNVHFLALSSYIGEWRWFLLDLEKEVEAVVSLHVPFLLSIHANLQIVFRDVPRRRICVSHIDLYILIDPRSALCVFCRNGYGNVVPCLLLQFGLLI